MQGCRLRECWFEPTFHKHAGKLCAGVQIHVEDGAYDHEQFKPWRLMALAFKALRRQRPDYELWRDFAYEYEYDRLAIDLINGGELGTTCARVGCMPSKAMIQSAEDYHSCRHPRKYGITGHDGIGIELDDTMEHVRHLRDIFVDRVLSHSTDDMGEEFIEDHARFLEPTLLEVGERRIRAAGPPCWISPHGTESRCSRLPC